jgi:hypothetical protein
MTLINQGLIHEVNIIIHPYITPVPGVREPMFICHRGLHIGAVRSPRTEAIVDATKALVFGTILAVAGVGLGTLGIMKIMNVHSVRNMFYVEAFVHVSLVQGICCQDGRSV